MKGNQLKKKTIEHAKTHTHKKKSNRSTYILKETNKSIIRLLNESFFLYLLDVMCTRDR